MAGTILVVEDDPFNNQLLSLILEGAGFSVVRAFDGAEAITKLEIVPVDAVLCDEHMPEVGGVGVCRFMKSRPALSEKPFVLLSASDEPDLHRDARLAGAREILVKPFNRRELLALLSSLTAQVTRAIPAASR